MEIIKINNVTKDYGDNKGCFNINFSINKGEVFGFLGPNGAGKTTTIRMLLGFIKADSGNLTINGLDCFNETTSIMNSIGYLPGEPAMFNDMTGDKFIDFMLEYKGIKDRSKADELINLFELNTKVKIKKMSKGMKQKVALVTAFMNDSNIIILDEPTSGLDPLMQKKFIDVILRFKAEGKTILLSSHIFEEVEKTCDRIAIIKKGKIVSIDETSNIRNKAKKSVEIIFNNIEDKVLFEKETDYKLVDNKLSVDHNNINELLKIIGKYEIKDITISNQSLEEMFMHFYGD